MKSYTALKKKHDLNKAGKKVADWAGKVNQLLKHLRKRRGVTVNLKNAWIAHDKAKEK